jgi:hypothetical protein
VRAASRDSIHGVNTNWMNAKGSRTRMKSAPLIRTAAEKARPASERNVMSPKPSVDIVVRDGWDVVHCDATNVYGWIVLVGATSPRWRSSPKERPYRGWSPTVRGRPCGWTRSPSSKTITGP